MSYTKLTDFAAKDALLSGNPSKLLRGTEIGAEFDAIESAMAAAEAVNITAPIIVASTSKTTPVDADVLPILDSAAANILKKVTWANIKATLKTYFDTLYGAGGTVIQATSKSTAVTLNKPTGKITMSADSLAAGAKVSFVCNNSLVTSNDTVVMNLAGGSVNPDQYLIRARIVNSAITFTVVNQGAAGYAEAIVINFAIIKGAVA